MDATTFFLLVLAIIFGCTGASILLELIALAMWGAGGDDAPHGPEGGDNNHHD